MIRTQWLTSAATLLIAFVGSMAVADEDGFKPIFDGKTLKDWDGNPDFWRVEEGAIVGQTTPEKKTNGNTFIIWRGGELADFELKCEFKIEGGNSGIQYRSFEVPDNKWVIGGYQADIDSNPTGGFTGIVYGERFRGILCNRGKKAVIGDDHKPKDVGDVGDPNEIIAKVKKGDWNEYHITAQGFRFVQKINGVTTAELTDEDKEQRKAKGLLALQLHAGPPMKVQFRNIRLKTLKSDARAQAVQSADSDVVLHGVSTTGKAGITGQFLLDSKSVLASHLIGGAGNTKKKVLLLAGRRSHGFGAHDHTAGCSLLAKLLNDSGLVEAKTHSLEKDGWPKAEELQAASTLVIYSDGGGGHPFNAHLKELDELTAKGTGIVCIHYGVEVPKGESGDKFLEWTGGYFEPHWSVNPHWVANYTKFPEHPVTRGVKPFKTNDEWYYHMRFRENLDGVVPILTDLPPKESLSRPDGPHSGNPDVRKAVLERKEPQHMAWARQRPDGGRGFGCSGGHVHWNWGNDQFRKLILNAIVWTAGEDVPRDGVPAGKVAVDDLLQNHDEPIPADFNKARIQAMLDEWNGAAS